MCLMSQCSYVLWKHWLSRPSQKCWWTDGSSALSDSAWLSVCFTSLMSAAFQIPHCHSSQNKLDSTLVTELKSELLGTRWPTEGRGQSAREIVKSFFYSEKFRVEEVMKYFSRGSAMWYSDNKCCNCRGAHWMETENIVRAKINNLHFIV